MTKPTYDELVEVIGWDIERIAELGRWVDGQQNEINDLKALVKRYGTALKEIANVFHDRQQARYECNEIAEGALGDEKAPVRRPGLIALPLLGVVGRTTRA